MANNPLKPDPNFKNVSGGVTNDADAETRPLLVDPATGRLLVSGTSSITTEYTEGDTDTSFSGVMLLAEGPADTAMTLQLDASGFLKVSLEAVAAVGTLATAAKQDTGNTSLGVMDDWDESDRAKVNVIVGQAGISAGAGAVGADTPRVTHASDDPAVVALQLIDNLVLAEDAAHQSGDVGIQILAVRDDTLNARSGAENDYEPLHTNADGALWVLDVNSAAIAASLSVLDDFDESDRAKVNIVVGQAGVTAGAGAVAANTPRVTLASDDPAVASLATIAGDTTDIETAVEIMDDWDESDRAKVNIIVGQAGISAGAGAVGTTVPRVTLASDDPSVVSLQLIDDVVVADDAAFTPATTKVLMVGFEADEGSTDSVDEGDGGAARMTMDRKQIVTVQPHTAGGLSVLNATSSDGGTALTNSAQAISAAAGQVYGWYIYNPNTSAVFVQFYNTASGSVTVGTTNPLFMLTIPAGSAANVNFVQGIAFSNTGFSCAATSTAGGNGAPTTAIDAVIYYK